MSRGRSAAMLSVFLPPQRGAYVPSGEEEECWGSRLPPRHAAPSLQNHHGAEMQTGDRI